MHTTTTSTVCPGRWINVTLDGREPKGQLVVWLWGAFFVQRSCRQGLAHVEDEGLGSW